MVDRSIRWQRKSLTAGATLAKESLPMSESSSLLVALCLDNQDLVSPSAVPACQGGRRSCCADVLITMPRVVRVVVGPFSFSEATGMPNWSHNSSTLYMASRQVSLLGGPTRRKSSR